jgi:hypothetical protein
MFKSRGDLVSGALNNHDFISIGNAITKYTNTMEHGLEEQSIGIPVTDESKVIEKNPKIDVLEKDPIHVLSSQDRLDLRYYQDGIQRTQFVGNVLSEKLQRLVPILFTTVGAIVVHLEGEHVRQYLEPIIVEKFITPPRDLLPNEIRDAIPPAFLIEVPGYDKSTKPNDFRKLVFENEISNLRQHVEKEIMVKFEEKNQDDWLVVDGFIDKFDISDKKVGVIKRHGKDWLPPDIMFQVLKGFVSNGGQRVRSPLFKITYTTTRRPETVSCFTKYLYNFKAALATNPEFSLIRVEIPPRYKDAMEPILNTLLDLNSPMSNPSDQWDKKLYPILLAEKILKTHAKDDKMLRVAFGGLL